MGPLCDHNRGRWVVIPNSLPTQPRLSVATSSLSHDHVYLIFVTMVHLSFLLDGHMVTSLLLVISFETLSNTQNQSHYLQQAFHFISTLSSWPIFVKSYLGMTRMILQNATLKPHSCPPTWLLPQPVFVDFWTLLNHGKLLHYCCLLSWPWHFP